MKIGNIVLDGYAALAPMAGVADRAMREICAEMGAAFTVGELTSAKGVSLGDKKSATLLTTKGTVKPCASQLFGSEPKVMAEAARVALGYSPDFIDINMGCPAPKVAGNGGGSALMLDIDNAARIVEAVVGAVDIPVTVKMRVGWDSDSINAPELAVLCEKAGAAAITVHGRTRKQMYAPPVDYNTIAEVKSRVKIPVIANGDVVDGKSAKEILKITNCDFLMVGRAAMGNPFIFEEINACFEGKEYSYPMLDKRFEVMKRQVKLMCDYKDPHNAILESRKHTAWYMKGLKSAAELRRMCGEIICFDDIERICEKALEDNKDLW